MKCFECGALCQTKYIYEAHRLGGAKIVAVCKVCPNCEWESYPTKLPEKIN